MKTSEMFPSKYLSAAELNGKPRVVVIDNVVIEELGQTKDKRPVLYLQGGVKPMVLNQTNMKMISSLHGDETDDWHGRQIVLFEAMVDFRGETKAAIRVRAVRPTDAPSKAVKPKAMTEGTPFEDDVPF